MFVAVSMQKLQQAGWQLGLRFDPLIYQDDYRQHYTHLFEQVFSQLPLDYFRNIVRLYPDEPLIADSFSENGGMVSYPEELEHEMSDFCTRELLKHVPEALLFPCKLAA